MIGVPTQQSVQFRKALPVQVLHNFTSDSAVFDDDNLVSCAGLVPVMALAEQTGLAELLAEKVHIAEPKIKSGSANPAPKLATLIAGMCAGADSIDDRRRGALGWDEDLVRRRVRALDNRDSVAGVQFRPRPPVGVGAA